MEQQNTSITKADLDDATGRLFGMIERLNPRALSAPDATEAHATLEGVRSKLLDISDRTARLLDWMRLCELAATSPCEGNGDRARDREAIFCGTEAAFEVAREINREIDALFAEVRDFLEAKS
ncbi:MAG: hypothetical protein AAF318_12655 [Pseudomonadota bacterium]